MNIQEINEFQALLTEESATAAKLMNQIAAGEIKEIPQEIVASFIGDLQNVLLAILGSMRAAAPKVSESQT